MAGRDRVLRLLVLLALVISMTNAQLGTPCTRLDGETGNDLSVRISEATDEAIVANPLAYRALVGINGVLDTALAQFDVDVLLIQNDAIINPQEYFLLEDNFDGINVRLIKGLDRDGPTASENDDFVSVTFGLRCTDPNGVQTLYNLNIALNDANDNSPIFVNLPFIFSVEENSVGAIVGTVSAVDADEAGNPNSQVTYYLDSLRFTVNLQSGIISTIAALDFEDTSLYEIPIIARDTAILTRSATSTVTIRVTDVQDNVPLFTQASYVATVPENQPNELVAQVAATDADSVPQIVYTLVGDDSNLFTIQQDGRIFTTSNLDYETKTVYNFFATTQDGLGSFIQSASAAITVNVLDRNDNTPQISLADREITRQETTQIGTLLTTASATDGDPANTLNSRISFSIVSVNPASGRDLFLVDPNSGQIFLGRSFSSDDARATRYNVTVAATDFGTPALAGTAFLIVNVLRNEFSPTFGVQLFEATIAHTLAVDASVIEIPAQDADTTPPYNQLSYSITGDGNAPTYFKLNNPFSPLVVIARSLTQDDDLEYTIRVVATDGGGATATATAVITVLRNLNDPTFVNPIQERSLEENYPLNQIITTVEARDADVTVN
ncbi:protocadherin Fat 4 [Elysia marginata]|uniref:Protocadherin Fat 4 n=1 Tax=Elysia marginata TaxID=1093978 RepID=A0AAV4GUL7_9GAST|nr:protocadherin Fat 4 [Elysia marginata]